ncbi:response regulator transcription factor [Desulfofundulus thermocisternus]|uniref:response regulator transcription factor n=1 Tax=Desulfofundulus thermocisternus TaxID=42471 RepID=UPI001A0E1925|nr:response regulator transcription factor [Desulfofundulus thermocisternus]MBE3586371.1 response regulator transcription factor [Thermoanaerobacter sp.]MCS5697283.1 response regulator transcription factor [Desulfofundulus thermocisternus]
MKKILVADDEVKIRELVRLYLEREGFAVVEAADGAAALDYLAREHFDLVILDLMMPSTDGWTVCREMRKRDNPVPIIMLTARGDEIDRVLGLEMGADDYVVKPFSPRELVARVKAVLRRYGGGKNEPEVLVYDGLTIDPLSHRVEVNGQVVNLTPKEYDLLYTMALSPGRVFTREQLLEKVWGYDFFGEGRTVDTHITRLREKLSRVPGAPQCIVTVWGVGYKFEVNR